MSDTDSEKWIERKIRDISTHPDFYKKTGASYNDVAVLTLDKAVVFSDNIRPVCLPETAVEKADHLTGSAVSVSGWGITSVRTTEPSEVLKTAHVQIYNQRYEGQSNNT